MTTLYAAVGLAFSLISLLDTSTSFSLSAFWFFFRLSLCLSQHLCCYMDIRNDLCPGALELQDAIEMTLNSNM